MTVLTERYKGSEFLPIQKKLARLSDAFIEVLSKEDATQTEALILVKMFERALEKSSNPESVKAAKMIFDRVSLAAEAKRKAGET